MKPCKICKIEFKPKSKISVTCGSEECKHENYIYNRDKKRPDIESADVIMKNRFLINSWN